ncbi:MAG: DUF5118 domain-containing protein, partial [Gemmatimonadota bacterium]
MKLANARHPATTMVAAAAVALAGSFLCLTPSAAHAQMQDYETVVPSTAETDDGLFDVHRVEDRLLFEIPDSVLGRDMALMSRFARVQEGMANGGDRMAGNMVVRWERRGDRVYLRAVSHEKTADDGSSIHIAVE